MDNTASEHSMKCSVLSDTRALLGFRLCEFNNIDVLSKGVSISCSADILQVANDC